MIDLEPILLEILEPYRHSHCYVTHDKLARLLLIKCSDDHSQGMLTEWEGSVQFTSLLR
jgi:hypothetical protein